MERTKESRLGEETIRASGGSLPQLKMVTELPQRAKIRNATVLGDGFDLRSDLCRNIAIMAAVVETCGQ